MKHLDRQHLVDRLVGLFDPNNPGAPRDPVSLRRHITEMLGGAAAKKSRSEIRRVTILLSDLRGFTAITEKFPAMEMVAALNRYYARMTEIIQRHGGSIDKFMGDAIMALFGAPTPLQNDVEAALACAIEMQLAMDEVNAENKLHGMVPLHMGIGINTGDVVVGHLGSRLHSEYTAIGDPVNLASRVEAHSLRGQILLSESTFQQAKDFVDIGEINDVNVKGIEGTVRMYELLAVRGPCPLTAPKREVRKSPRVEVNMPLVFHTLDGKSVLPQEHLGRIVDIGYGGMFVTSPVELDPFVDIKMAISVSMMGREIQEIYAKVLRVSAEDGQYMFPVEFTSIEPTAQQAIKEFVDGILEINRH
jgi:adenylate cyclase